MGQWRVANLHQHLGQRLCPKRCAAHRGQQNRRQHHLGPPEIGGRLGALRLHGSARQDPGCARRMACHLDAGPRHLARQWRDRRHGVDTAVLHCQPGTSCTALQGRQQPRFRQISLDLWRHPGQKEHHPEQPSDGIPHLPGVVDPGLHPLWCGQQQRQRLLRVQKTKRRHESQLAV